MTEPDRITEKLTAFQHRNGLQLTTDAYLLSAFVPKNIKKSVCELCAGTGLISLMLLQNGKCGSAVCVDFQPQLCEMAENNAQLNGLSDKMKVFCTDLLDFQPQERFDRVVCNPPYLKNNTGKNCVHTERFLSLHETTAKIGEICMTASRILNFGGEAFFCYIPERSPDLFYSMKTAGIEPKTQLLIYPTAQHKPSLLLVSGKKGAKSGITTFPPVFIYKDIPGGEYTDYMKTVYENNSFIEKAAGETDKSE